MIYWALLHCQSETILLFIDKKRQGYIVAMDLLLIHRQVSSGKGTKLQEKFREVRYHNQFTRSVTMNRGH